MKVVKARLVALVKLRTGSKLQLSDEYGIVEVQVLEMTKHYITVGSDGLHEPYLLLTNSSLILILSDSHMGCSIWVKLVEIRKQKFERQLNVINPFPFL